MCPVTDAASAREALEAVRRDHPDASHHCWAYRLSDGTERSDDDGEPGGSAGRPILAQLAGHGVADALVVVARWFGGTKLGVGGLIRAYGGTAGKALDAAPLTEVLPSTVLRITYGYDDTSAVDAALAATDHDALDAHYGADVTRTVQVLEADAQALVEALAERSGGRVVCSPVDEAGA